MELLLLAYRDMMLSVAVGKRNGTEAVSKPLFILDLFDAIEKGSLDKNEISFENSFIRKRFGELYYDYNHSSRGYELSFFLRSYFHLGSSDFYNLLWKNEGKVADFSSTPSDRYLW